MVTLYLCRVARFPIGLPALLLRGIVECRYHLAVDIGYRLMNPPCTSTTPFGATIGNPHKSTTAFSHPRAQTYTAYRLAHIAIRIKSIALASRKEDLNHQSSTSIAITLAGFLIVDELLDK